MQHTINNFLHTKKSQIKPKYFTEVTTQHHKNRLHLSSLSPYPASQLDVSGHDGYSLSVDGTQITIFKQTHQVRFASLLQRADGGTLELQVGLEILGDLPHQPLERQFPDQKLGGFLVTTDFSKRNSPGPVAMRFLHPTGTGGAFPGCFCDQLLAGRFPTGWLTGSLLGSSHLLLPSAEVLGRFSDCRTAAAAQRANSSATGKTSNEWKNSFQRTTKPLCAPLSFLILDICGLFFFPESV